MAEIKDLASRKRPPIPRHLARAFSELENTVGGREKLIDLLQAAPETPDTARIIGAILDPTNDDRSLAGIAQDTGIALGKLSRIINETILIRAQLDSNIKVAEKLPAVVSNVMEKSVPHKVRCPTCDGLENSCKRCKGKGWIDKEPNREDQKIALELGGLLNKKGPLVNVNNVNQQNNVFASADMFKNFRDATDKVLYGPGSDDIVDAEKV